MKLVKWREGVHERGGPNPKAVLTSKETSQMTIKPRTQGEASGTGRNASSKPLVF